MKQSPVWKQQMKDYLASNFPFALYLKYKPIVDVTLKTK